jgi:hypothetical protein
MTFADKIPYMEKGLLVIPAPLAGYTDFAFRQILAECGATEIWTEMVSATALTKNNAKTLSMIKTVDGVRNVVQLFGCNPEHFSAVVRSGVLNGFDEININMGCPAPKIAKEGAGCSLMRNLALAKKIITETAKAIHPPAVSGAQSGAHFGAQTDAQIDAQADAQTGAQIDAQTDAHSGTHPVFVKNHKKTPILMALQ